MAVVKSQAVTLDDIIKDLAPEVHDILKKDFREELDKRKTILDLSYEALKVNVYRNTQVHLDAYNTAYDILVQALSRIATREYASLVDVPPDYFSKKNAGYVYINGGPNNRFIIASSFGAIDTVVRAVSRDPEVRKTQFGTSNILTQKKDKKGRILPDEYDKTERRKVDIGHIPSEGNDNLTSPLEEKITSILQLGRSTSNSALATIAEQALADLYSIQADVSYQFKNTTPEAINLAKSIVGEQYVVVTLHRKKLNNAFSTQEAKIFHTLKEKIIKVLKAQPISKISGSNNIEEDIAEQLANIMLGSKAKPKQHSKKSKVTTTPSIKATAALANKSIKIKKQKSTAIKPIQALNLTNLQNLLNQRLHDQIRANMGTGSSKNILNYRQGRLTQSAKVERMQESRQGMITAFYTYMKYPYATFSDGGRQQYPKSRDPKLLIAKSIREIAGTTVANRMRAVNV